MANLSDPITEGPCKNALCGEGKCRPDSHNLFGYDCDCYKGWATPKVLNLTVLPSCVIPDSCAFVLCGHGDCVGTDDGGYRCDCHKGSSNVLNLTALACIKDCPPCDIHFGQNPSTSISGASATANKEHMMRGRTSHIIILVKARSLHVL
ncbi:hypothetical protein QJS10_CPB14g01141 [Acorus calamus]|uniref:EGF-like domain-containing protein n=1 Tax=Acorus calamus TaxID=4465 RepID=A0AAV9DD98_ACOCL|nr:hypothetical protein QJS10_CPB14g01141 [Acorus calamus]